MVLMQDTIHIFRLLCRKANDMCLWSNLGLMI